MVVKSIEASESLKFYKYLCKRIGSEEVVRIRRLAFVISDIGQRYEFITSGSKGEGLDLNGSDLDVMQIDTCLKVFESDAEIEGQKIPLIMNTEETQPCFTQLCFPNHPNLRLSSLSKTVLNMSKKHHLGCVLSSELYKQFIMSKASFARMSPKIHGPSISDEEDTTDFVYCLKCDKWIFQAEPWVSRSRTIWPPPTLISQIISCGVLFVPIGCKGSINEHLEWRISFSVAEKFLIFSFSHTQLLCYAMLKIVLKEIIETHEDLKGLLCSYFLKTLMFWISEETDPYVWRPDNIIPCFMACLQRLMYCVRYSILSHYFIPENNLFFLRFNTNNKNKIITILKNSYRQRINCFASSQTLQDYQSQSCELTDSLISGNINSLHQLMPTFSFIRNQGKFDRVSRLLYNFIHISRTGLSRSLFALQLSAAFMFLPEATKYQYKSGNTYHYFCYKHDLSYLMIGLHSDAVSGLLMLASFFYRQKHYLASITVITYTLQKITDEKMYAGIFNHKRTFNHTQQYVLNMMKKEKLHTIVKSLIIHRLRFDLNSSIIPQELQLDVASTDNLFHPLPFAHFLSFLCYYHLHEISSCRQSLQRLTYSQWALSNGVFKGFYPDYLNTIIFCGICFNLMGETYIARRAFQKAAKSDKHNSTSAASRFFSLI